MSLKSVLYGSAAKGSLPLVKSNISAATSQQVFTTFIIARSPIFVSLVNVQHLKGLKGPHTQNCPLDLVQSYWSYNRSFIPWFIHAMVPVCMIDWPLNASMTQSIPEIEDWALAKIQLWNLNCDTKWSRERKFENGDWFLSRRRALTCTTI
jgi:hypothetical protein